MKAKMITTVVAMALLFVAFSATPAWAGAKTTDYTGTVSFVDFQDLTSWKYAGRTIHDLANWYFYFDTTDPRLTGMYVLEAQCNWPKGAFISGVCQANWTLDVDGDGQSDWVGVVEVTNNGWNGSGHGLGQYAGLNVMYKVRGPFEAFVVDGRVQGN